MLLLAQEAGPERGVDNGFDGFGVGLKREIGEAPLACGGEVMRKMSLQVSAALRAAG